MKLTKLEKQALLAMANYMLDAPCLEYLEVLSEKEERTHRRAQEKLRKALDD